MNINNAVHALIKYIIHHLLYSVHPCCVDQCIIINDAATADLIVFESSVTILSLLVQLMFKDDQSINTDNLK